MGRDKFHIIKIRACSQCGNPLAQKCDRCKCNPKRRPKIVEVYELPPILKTAECGCCVQIECQWPPCKATFWRVKRLSTIYRSLFHSRVCSSAYGRSQITKTARIPVKCAECGAAFTKKPSDLKRSKNPGNVFDKRVCYVIWCKKQKANALRRQMEDEERTALFYCRTCNDVVEQQAEGLEYRCALCRTLNKAEANFSPSKI